MVRRLHGAGVPGRDVFVWDVDKTYLDSGFESRRELIRTAMERAGQKRSIPGTAQLLQVIRRADSEPRPLYFITASPPQIASAIEGKLALDGITFDGICYKNQLRLAARREFDQLRVQIAFKLAALLSLFAEREDFCRFHLFGDDVEHDALTYCLFADVASGRVRGSQLRDVLTDLKVRARYAIALREYADELPRRDCVAGIYIHLVRKPDGSSLASFDGRVVGWEHAGAAAQSLCSAGLLTSTDVQDVAAAAPPSEPRHGQAPLRSDGLWTPEGILS